jgi:hypothetical protein
MSDSKEREALIEAAASAFRGTTPLGEVLSHPAWEDLDEAGRKEAFALATKLRKLEAAIDPLGQSSTTKAVLQRLRSMPKDQAK